MDGEYNKLINRIRHNSSTAEDHDEIISLFGRTDLEYELKDALYSQLEKTDNYEDVDLNLMYRRLWEKISDKDKANKLKFNRSLIRKIISVAAIVAIGFIIGGVFNPFTQSSEPVFFTSISPKGSISKMYLPDSTLVYLNADSEMKYRLGGENGKREVFLSGEAWFSVKKNADKAFIVHTDFYKVKVLGTEFNVRAYEEDNEVTTTLEEGKIEIFSGNQLKLKNPVIIKPGEQISYNKKERKINIKEVNSSLYSSWKNNKLIFINKNFKELVEILERKYGVDIHVKDTSIYKYHYDGTIKDESIFEMLDLIKTTLPIKYHINDQEITIEKK